MDRVEHARGRVDRDGAIEEAARCGAAARREAQGGEASR
jgi:hypothetical protein